SMCSPAGSGLPVSPDPAPRTGRGDLRAERDLAVHAPPVAAGVLRQAPGADVGGSPRPPARRRRSVLPHPPLAARRLLAHDPRVGGRGPASRDARPRLQPVPPGSPAPACL